MKSVVVSLLLLLCARGSLSRSSGPPIGESAAFFEAICVQLWPQRHGPINNQQIGSGGYVVFTDLKLNSEIPAGFNYTAQTTYRVIIQNDLAEPFRGFLVQARSQPDNITIGQFTVKDPNLQQNLDCDATTGVISGGTASHANLGPADNFVEVDLHWTAPNNDGVVDILFTIVERFSIYYIARSAAEAQVVETPLLMNPQDYRLTFRTPSDCLLPDCITFVGINTSTISGYLDIYMQGIAQAWVAVGFSETRSMFDADVLACNLNPATGMVELLDTWNVPSPGRSNIVDTKTDTFALNSTNVNGVISCAFKARIAGTNIGTEDLNLDQQLWVMWGVGQNPVSGQLAAHEVTPRDTIPQLSDQKLNPVVDADPAPITIPVNNPAFYNLTYRTPRGCFPPNCTTFVGVAVNQGNPAFLDFYMEGVAQAWVAMGFSKVRDMYDADVLGCNVNRDTGMLEIIDTWNPTSPERTNTADTVSDVTPFTATMQAGVITCTFVRSIAGTIVGSEDINLNQKLFGMWGVGNIRRAGALAVHEINPNPQQSVQPLNPVLDTDLTRVVEPIRAPQDYRLILRQPPPCNVSDCDIFVGIDNNVRDDQFLDIYMEANTQAWVAVGFTGSRSMFSADVLACNVNPDTDMVEALDTWNAAVGRSNLVDARQDVVLFNSSFQDGRISCVMGRYFPGSPNPNLDEQRDLNLNSSYFILYGIRPDNPTAGILTGHNGGPGNPLASIRVNPVLSIQSDLNATGAMPDGVTEPVIAAENYRLIFRNPPGCPPSDCDIFVGIETNQGNNLYLDIYIEGQAEAWVAIGFSDTPNMFDADVLGCNINPDTGIVDVLDTWNPSAPTRGNIPDSISDVFLFNGNSDNGRISCSFARLTAGSDTSGAQIQDLDLNNDYFAIYGVRPANPGAQALAAHVLGVTGNPTVSGARANPSTDRGEVLGDVTRARLTRAHGILMIIAWPVMAVTAIFFAAWMRPALPNGEWFQVHRILMSGSIVVASIAFLLIFVANRNNSPPGLIQLGSANPTGTAHYIIGIIVMFMQLLNPMISLCRCKPDDKNRWIFNLIHGTFVGMVAELLALTNVGIGLAIFSRMSRFGDLTIFWVYMGYLGFFLALVMVLFLLFTVLAYTSTGEDRSKLVPSLVKPLVESNIPPVSKNQANVGVELTVPGAKPSKPDMTKPKIPSKDSPVRWVSLLIYAVVMISFMIILVILVAI